MKNPVYDNYWRRKHLLNQGTPHFPVVRWWSTPDLCDIERVYFDRIKTANSVLDVGAGDLRVKNKFVNAGFTGTYHTQDIGGEYQHTYQSLDEVASKYDVVICLDVIEHLPLREGLGLVQRITELLAPGGTLIVQTPNARCNCSPYSWDMTHLHTYNLPDLWAYLTAMGLDVKGYRVPFEGPKSGMLERIQKMWSRWLITRCLGNDYANNIAVVATLNDKER